MSLLILKVLGPRYSEACFLCAFSFSPLSYSLIAYEVAAYLFFCLAFCLACYVLSIARRGRKVNTKTPFFYTFFVLPLLFLLYFLQHYKKKPAKNPRSRTKTEQKLF